MPLYLRLCCTISFLLFTSIISRSQHVGINNSNPEVALDIKGAIATRPEPVFIVTQPITTFEISSTSYIRFSSNSSQSNIDRFINLKPGKSGQHLILEFTGEGAARMVNGSGLSNGGKLLLASSMTFDDPSLIALIFDGTNWKELYRNESIKSETSNDSSVLTTAGTFNFRVPPGITKLTVTLSGGGGWGGGASSNPFGQGGRGGFVSGELAVTEGELLTILVAAGGKGGVSAIRGGISAIKRGETFLALAAGGGNGSRNGGYGGRAGQNADDGTKGTSIHNIGTPGSGATAIAGGAGGSAGTQGDIGLPGTALTGGINQTEGSGRGEGWGGDGWFGGGASGTYSFIGSGGPLANGGGGGGSNYTGGLSGTIVNTGNGSLGGQGNTVGISGVVKIVW